MDILAARKKAAELAKAGKAQAAGAPAEPVSDSKNPAEDRRPGENFVEPASAGPRAEESPSLPLPPPAEPPAAQPVMETAEIVPEQQQEQELEMLAFLLGDEEYVVPVDLVGEVLTPREVTPVPHVPSYMVGVCSLRGMVLPVIDLKRRLGLEEGVRDEKSRIIVAALGPDDRVGLFVDRVRGVVKILPSSVRPAPETVDQAEGAAFLRGIARKDDRLYIILDVEKTVAVV